MNAASASRGESTSASMLVPDGTTSGCASGSRRGFRARESEHRRSTSAPGLSKSRSGAPSQGPNAWRSTLEMALELDVRWSGRRDLNPRPQRPERCALPSCATSRRPVHPHRSAPAWLVIVAAGACTTTLATRLRSIFVTRNPQPANSSSSPSSGIRPNRSNRKPPRVT